MNFGENLFVAKILIVDKRAILMKTLYLCGRFGGWRLHCMYCTGT